MNIKKIVYIVAGCMGVGMGAVGAIVPMLPAFPFLLLAAFCFGRSSKRLNHWFIHMKLYQENLESYIRERGMNRKTKIRIMVMITILLSIGFLMMSRVPMGRILLVLVWLFHFLYFLFGIRTLE